MVSGWRRVDAGWRLLLLRSSFGVRVWRFEKSRVRCWSYWSLRVQGVVGGGKWTEFMNIKFAVDFRVRLWNDMLTGVH